jgi:hypothetical protein
MAVLVMACAVATPVASAAPDGLSAEQVTALEQRVRERWAAMIDHDFGKVWEFNTPTYREVFPKSMYVHKFSYAVQWQLTSIEVVDYDADAAVASVAVGVMSQPTKQTSEASKALGAIPSTIDEKWILIDGEWWHSAKI